MDKRSYGFTIVELLIVIVVIAVLAAVSIVAYNGIQSRSNDAKVLAEFDSARKALNLYYAQNGEYPKTTSLTDGRTDPNCNVGTKSADWIPGVSPAFVSSLPKSSTNKNGWTNDGCFQYASDGATYVLSAWRMLRSAQTSTFYRRDGFREGWTAAQGSPISYHCAGNSNPVAYWDNYYQYSYTVTNATACY